MSSFLWSFNNNILFLLRSLAGFRHVTLDLRLQMFADCPKKIIKLNVVRLFAKKTYVRANDDTLIRLYRYPGYGIKLRLNATRL